MFTAALFTIARTWKQSKCPSTEEWIKKMWYIYTMEYYSAIRRNEIGSFVEARMNWESYRVKSEREKQMSYNNVYIWNLEKWYTWSYLQSRNRSTDIANKCMYTGGKEVVWEEPGEWDWHIYTNMYKTDN